MFFIIQEDTITCQVKKNREIIFPQFSFPMRYFDVNLYTFDLVTHVSFSVR